MEFKWKQFTTWLYGSDWLNLYKFTCSSNCENLKHDSIARSVSHLWYTLYSLMLAIIYGTNLTTMKLCHHKFITSKTVLQYTNNTTNNTLPTSQHSTNLSGQENNDSPDHVCRFLWPCRKPSTGLLYSALHTVCCALHTVCYSLHGMCCALHTVCCALHTVCCALHTVCCALHTVCY